MFTLEVQSGNQVRTHNIIEQIVTIGRSSDNTIPLEDPLTSRHHAKIELIDSALYISDLGSSNGTQVNSAELEPRIRKPLTTSDTVKIGDTVFTLREVKGQAAPPPSAVPAADAREKQRAAPSPAKSPTVTVSSAQGIKEIELTRDSVTIGRTTDNDIVLDQSEVSRHHAVLHKTPQGYEISDLGSTNGLTFNGNRIDKKLIKDGDVMQIAGTISFNFHVPAVEVARVPAMQAARATAFVPGQPLIEEKLVIKDQTSLTLGRDASCNVVLNHPIISRKHARIFKSDSTYYIEDLGSSNGTFLNDKPVTEPQKLKVGDIIYVGPIKFVFSPESLRKVDQSRNLQIDIVGVKKQVTKTVNLLKDISLTIKPNEFVAIVGGSGAGKSTLLKALIGFSPASDGAILINNDNLYSNFGAHRNKFGFVPQEDIIHKELTVYEALDYSARLRLPADTTAADRQKRIFEVLKQLDLTERKDLPIHKLSGGQLKRVSIGVELLTDPGIFCLDEATSGLDPGIESQMMRLLRKLSDNGHSIVIVTHATKNVMLCDKVIFLARGGYLAYFGPPEGALEYFGVKDFDQIYETLEKTSTPKEWGEKFIKSPQYQQYIGSRMAELGTVAQEPPQKTLGRQPKQISALSQFLILSRRNINIILRDKIALALILLLAPLTGSIHFLLWNHDLFDLKLGDTTKIVMALYMAAVIAFIAASLSVAREIVKEADIYRRERTVTLKIFPYVLSKILLALILTLYQSIIFLVMIKLASGWPGGAEFLPAFITMNLAVFSAMMAGLFISAIAPNQNAMVLLLIVILVPQCVFGGILPVSTYGIAGEVLSNTSTTKWVFESLVNISGVGKDVAEDPCWQLPTEQRKKLSEADKNTCKCLGPNVFTKCNFPGIRSDYEAAVDQPEPKKPVKPADPPPEPGTAPEQPKSPGPTVKDLYGDPVLMVQYQRDMDKWKDEMDVWKEKGEKYKAEVSTYKEKMNKYEADIKEWQVVYQKWQEERSRAIGKAEGIIDSTKEKWGAAFKINLAIHWSIIMFINAIIFVLILGAIKLKDRRK